MSRVATLSRQGEPLEAEAEAPRPSNITLPADRACPKAGECRMHADQRDGAGEVDLMANFTCNRALPPGGDGGGEC
jgi:hypothetical protein